jgi:hypothetical protein
MFLGPGNRHMAMDATSVEALSALRTSVLALLPAVADPALQPSVVIQPLTISPLGLGGFVGVHDDPVGDIVGRRVEAIALVGVKAPADGLDAAVAGAITALLAADRATLLGHGLLRIAVDKIGEATSGSDPVQQPVSFRVLHEFLKTPTAPEDVIQSIPVNVQLG